MILKVFMLIMVSTGWHGGGLSMTSIEFSDIETCQRVKKEILANLEGKRIIVECYTR